MRASLGLGFGVVSTFALLTACGGALRSGSVDEDAGVADAGLPYQADTGVSHPDASKPNPPSNIYPASHSPIPPVTYNGGNILDAPEVVTVTFDGDAQRATLEKFGDVITSTPWWTAVSAEYCDARGKCIGPGTGGVYAHIATAAALSYTDSSQGAGSTLQAFISAHIQDGTMPPPDANTLYVMYFPSSTTITLDSAQSCREFGAYHNAMTATPPGGAAPVTFAYAVMPRCSSGGGGGADMLTFAASHEIIEAATDPYLAPSAQSYDAFGSTSDAWDMVLGGGEVADRCGDFTGANSDQYRESGFLVERSWSNAAAKASHDPCVPAPPPSQQPYFNVAPTKGDMLDLRSGQTVTLELTAFSDAPTGPFAIDVSEVSSYFGGTNVLDLSLDQTQLQNGQKAYLTVTLSGSSSQGFAAFMLTSTLGQVTHSWSFFVNTM